MILFLFLLILLFIDPLLGLFLFVIVFPLLFLIIQSLLLILIFSLSFKFDAEFVDFLLVFIYFITSPFWILFECEFFFLKKDITSLQL